MSQLSLPFSRFRPIPALHALWFHYANAAEFGPEKFRYFYPFKTRFLHAHALPEGCDLQVIKRKCKFCNGTGIWMSDYSGRQDLCYRCNNGVYRTDEVILSRWLLNGTIYHCPESRLTRDNVTVRSTIRGYVKHEHVPAYLGRRCMDALLLRYAPRLLLIVLRERINQFFGFGPYYFGSWFTRFSYDMRRAWRENFEEADDIPF